MRIIILLLTFIFLTACGKKDTIELAPVPATATEPAKPLRPVANKPAKETFFLDFLL